ncbi:GPW/gp25 family protein [Accumulibacter sp.]|uniref:Baseplate wedge subunit n=1 Tax=Candidatus Accumulibacter phosphatis TaxID=327160 RepID=A0A080LYV2_9PROT|nr:GPW/gp25 family protein [Accumulibacter sp.]KFB74043.1 MAG: baseplate wedge subunit [Candidatus Accumulibacter phosphatis]HRF06667.1 GPW/gp25 family protein [Accumulibacter sp.]
MASLSDTQYLKFPFAIGADGPLTSSRADHVREQIEQLLFTSPKERVFRPEFGVGIRRLVFEPNNAALWNITHKQLLSSLAEALHGEVDSRTLKVSLEQRDAELVILISYQLAAINRQESQAFSIGGTGNG